MFEMRYIMYNDIAAEHLLGDPRDIVVSLAEIITNVDEVDLIMVNSISNPIERNNKNNLDVIQLAAMVKSDLQFYDILLIYY